MLAGSINYADFYHILPEIFLTGIGILLLVVGVYSGNNFYRSISRLAALGLILTLLPLSQIAFAEYNGFNGMFTTSFFVVFIKIMLLVTSAVVSLMYLEYSRSEPNSFFEFPVMLIFSVVGMMVMVSAGDLLTLYLGLELQSLSLYILAASNRDSIKSSEAGLKYFILGALGSGMLLYGISLVYGFTGTTNFAELTDIYQNLSESETALPLGVLIGMVMIVVAMCFKVSAVPFHMWAPDVYEGSPTIVTAFFASVPKIAALAIFIRVLMEAFGGLIDEWRQIIIFVSAASMILGSIAAIRQTNIKRLLAYSSIGHVGYILIGLASVQKSNPMAIQGVLIYMVLYVVMSIGIFAGIIFMRRNYRPVEKISDLAGLAKESPLYALAISIFMLSMAGIPPLAGFFGKFYIFLAAIQQHLYGLATLGVITSVAGAYYYINIIKIMYFDGATSSLDRPKGILLKLIMGSAAIFNVIFFIYPSPLLYAAKLAASALY